MRILDDNGKAVGIRDRLGRKAWQEASKYLKGKRRDRAKAEVAAYTWKVSDNYVWKLRKKLGIWVKIKDNKTARNNVYLEKSWVRMEY